MQRLRAGWLSFRRIHLAALIADRRRTLLSVIGVAVGVTVVLGVVVGLPGRVLMPCTSTPGSPNERITSAVMSRVLADDPAVMSIMSHSESARAAVAFNSEKVSGTMP